MKSKIFIIGLVAVIIIGIYFAVKKPADTIMRDQSESLFSFSEQDAQNDMEEMSSEEVVGEEQMSVTESVSNTVVNYTDNGFSPASLEIKVGETVQFVNQSGGGMWTASGPHPAHTNYPEFDAKRNIPSGETYEFTFTKVGEWKYHNHTKAGAYGTIIVK